MVAFAIIFRAAELKHRVQVSHGEVRKTKANFNNALRVSSETNQTLQTEQYQNLINTQKHTNEEKQSNTMKQLRRATLNKHAA